MRVLKVVAEGPTTSFRYPHFMQGVQPTFEMPPPATIYGHICSTLGEWVAPDGVQFAYHFTHQGEFDDVEHVHMLARAQGYFAGTKVAKVVEGSVNPFRRSLLFKPRLVLYLNQPQWLPAFRSPYYAVVLGRSQDLFTYLSIGLVDLEPRSQAYFEHTLAPYTMALRGAPGYVVLMPRFLDYRAKRSPTFARYVILPRRVYAERLLRYEGWPVQDTYFVDPESPEEHGSQLGLLFHSFVGEYGDEPAMA